MNKVLVFYSTGPEIKHLNKTLDDGVGTALDRLGQGWRVTQANSTGMVSEGRVVGSEIKRSVLTIITTIILEK